ncbi:MAG: hypothetical protein SF053_15775 [Bacteroidia bacterium]|nr:hypothetical protein [Bacteroidia bacterium]
MNLSTLKLRLLNHLSQVLVFRRDGTLVASCNSLADTSALEQASVYALFPMLDSIRELFDQLDQSAKPIAIPAVDGPMLGRPGVYDFEIYGHPESPELLVCLVVDHTALYRRLQEVQQERNLLLLEQAYQQRQSQRQPDQV